MSGLENVIQAINNVLDIEQKKETLKLSEAIDNTIELIEKESKENKEYTFQFDLAITLLYGIALKDTMKEHDHELTGQSSARKNPDTYKEALSWSINQPSILLKELNSRLNDKADFKKWVKSTAAELVCLMGIIADFEAHKTMQAILLQLKTTQGQIAKTFAEKMSALKQVMINDIVTPEDEVKQQQLTANIEVLPDLFQALVTQHIQSYKTRIARIQKVATLAEQSHAELAQDLIHELDKINKDAIERLEKEEKRFKAEEKEATEKFEQERTRLEKERSEIDQLTTIMSDYFSSDAQEKVNAELAKLESKELEEPTTVLIKQFKAETLKRKAPETAEKQEKPCLRK